MSVRVDRATEELANTENDSAAPRGRMGNVATAAKRAKGKNSNAERAPKRKPKPVSTSVPVSMSVSAREAIVSDGRERAETAERETREAREACDGALRMPVGGGGCGESVGDGPRRGELVRLMPGTLEDLDALARCHYRRTMRGVRPATAVCVISARTERELVGVMVVSMPVLNGPWRASVWPRLFGEGALTTRVGKRAQAEALNANVRTISRVIVDPRYRNLGIATWMVSHYLKHALTPATEALSAMGRSRGFFERAGMTAHRLMPSRADRVLRRRLRQAKYPAWRLMDVERACDEMVRAEPGTAMAGVERELRRWAMRSRATRHACGERRNADVESAGEMVLSARTRLSAGASSAAQRVRRAELKGLVTLAAMRLGSRPVVYSWGGWAEPEKRDLTQRTTELHGGTLEKG